MENTQIEPNTTIDLFQENINMYFSLGRNTNIDFSLTNTSLLASASCQWRGQRRDQLPAQHRHRETARHPCSGGNGHLSNEACLEPLVNKQEAICKQLTPTG